MDTRHLVDPEILPVIEALPFREFTRDNLPQARAESAERFKLLGEPVIPARQLAARRADGSEIELYLYDPVPGGTERAALYHIHGGGMILGSAKDMGFGPSGMAAALGIPVLSVEYRLA